MPFKTEMVASLLSANIIPTQYTMQIIIIIDIIIDDDELFCGMVDRRKAFSLISSWDHCQRCSPSRILTVTILNSYNQLFFKGKYFP